MLYTTGSIEVKFVTCEVDYLMYCGFMFLWSAAYVWWSCFSPFPPVLGCCSTGRAVGGLCARGNWEEGRAGLGRDGVAGLVPWLPQGQQGSVGSGGDCSFVSECATTGSLVRHITGFNGQVSLLLMTLILKFKCESLNTNASETCSHSSLQYLRISLDLITNPSELQTNQM